MKRRTAVLCLGMSAVLLLVACEKRERPQETAPESTAPAVEETQPAEEEFPGLTGLELRENSRAINENGDVFLTAVLDWEAQLEGQYIAAVNLYDLGEEHMLVGYTLSDRPSSREFDIEYEEGASFEHWLASYNMVTGQVDGKVQLPGDDQEGEAFCYSYQEQKGSLLWNRRMTDEMLTAVGYDSQLQQVVEYTTAVGVDGYGYFSPDGSEYYVAQNGMIVRYPTAGDGGDGEKLTLQQSFSVMSMGELFTDEQGVSYATVYGLAGDMFSYDGIVNLETGELVYLSRERNSYLTVQRGVLVSEDYAAGATYTIWTGEQPHSYTWSGEYISCEILSNGDLLFYCSEVEEDDSTLFLGLYDGETGMLISSTSFQVENRLGWLDSMVLSQTAENELLLCVTGEGQSTLFFTWEFGGANHEMSSMTVTETVIPDQLKPEIEESWDPNSMKPGECLPELADLRQRADQMEEEYGVQIYISEECTNYLDSYVIMPESDYDTVQQALDVLEGVLAKYPEGFFEQFQAPNIEGIAIYLAGTIMGRSEGVLDYAGGLQTETEAHLAVVLDSRDPYSLTFTLHHELGHAIESKINYYSQAWIVAEEWAELNPDSQVYGDCYLYSYDSYTERVPENLNQFIYMMGDPADAYFVDDYSLTYPTEDRARLFEYVMNTDCGVIDWEEAPHLRAKVNKFAACIREAFDTTGWENVPWEAFLDS